MKVKEVHLSDSEKEVLEQELDSDDLNVGKKVMTAEVPSDDDGSVLISKVYKGKNVKESVQQQVTVPKEFLREIRTLLIDG